MEEIAETLINNINNVIKVLNDTESCERVEELKCVLIDILTYSNNSIDFEIWAPLEEEDRKEWY